MFENITLSSKHIFLDVAKFILLHDIEISNKHIRKRKRWWLWVWFVLFLAISTQNSILHDEPHVNVFSMKC